MSVLSGANVPVLRELFAADRSARPAAGEFSWDRHPPVWSGGQSDHPDYALVFVNPTYRNQAVREDWPDELRAPHIGAKRMWEFFHACGLLPDYVPSSLLRSKDPPACPDGKDIPRAGENRSGSAFSLPPDGHWTQDDAIRVYGAAADAGLYITNLVKACRTDSRLPSMPFARSYLTLLKDELGIVQPRYVVIMGGLVSSLMLERSFSPVAAYDHLRVTGRPLMFGQKNLDSRPDDETGSHSTSDSQRPAAMVPSYFPCGRGDPAKAKAIITALVSSTRHDHDPELNCWACYYGEPSQWSREKTAVQET
jgi:hypothetical protein